MSMSSLDDAANYRLVRSWVRSVSSNTGRKYINNIKQFCAFSKLNPEELVSLAQTDKMSAKEKLVDFYQECVRKGYASNTSRNSFMAVRSFLNYNEIRFGRFAIAVHADSQYESRRIFTRDEVFRILFGVRSPSDNALISFVLHR